MPHRTILVCEQNNLLTNKPYVWPEPFDLFDSHTVYPGNTVFVYDHYLSFNGNHSYFVDLMVKHLQQGYRIVYLNPSEHVFPTEARKIIDIFRQYPQQHLIVISGQRSSPDTDLNVLAIDFWFWMQTQTYWPEPLPTQNPQFKVLCKLGQIRKWRNQVFEALENASFPVLKSYWGKGQNMPHDPAAGTRDLWQLNPSWYADSCLSLVCETLVTITPRDIVLSEPPGIFHTEKTFKPVAMQHPFLLLACPGSLNAIKKMGFETFGEFWDESYDLIEDFDHRLLCVMNQIQHIDPAIVTLPALRQKLEFNRNRFIDADAMKTMIDNKLFGPIVDFLDEKT